MRPGDKIAGWDGLHRHPKHNYHIIDERGRAVYCGCMPNIRHGGGYLRLRVNRRSKAHHLEQWYREYRFESNLERNEKKKETT